MSMGPGLPGRGPCVDGGVVLGWFRSNPAWRRWPDCGLLALPVGLAVEDEFVGGGLEPVDRRIGRAAGRPSWRATRSGSRFEVTIGAGRAVAFDDELVDVGGVGGVESVEREVVDHEQVDAEQLAHLGVVAVVEPGGA